MYNNNTGMNRGQVPKYNVSKTDAPTRKHIPVTEQNYVEEAEQAIIRLKEKKNKNGKTVEMVTTSKLRNLLAMTADIYNIVMNCDTDTINEELCSRIEYLRVRFMYEAGREPKVKALLEETSILELLKQINGSKKNYILFNRYMESLVAFHRYYGGKDN